MKKLLSIALVLLVAAVTGWVNRVDLLLMAVKYQSEREFDVAPAREVPWQTGPAEAASTADERPPNLSLIHISEPTRPLYISYAVFCLRISAIVTSDEGRPCCSKGSASSARSSLKRLGGRPLSRLLLTIATTGPIPDGVGVNSNPVLVGCLLYTSPSPRDLSTSRMPSSA